MAEFQVAKLTDQFEMFLDAFEKLDTYVLHDCMNKQDQAAAESKTVSHLREILSTVIARRAYLSSKDLDRMFQLFTQALSGVQSNAS